MPRIRTSSAPEVLVPLDRESPEPLHRQLEQSLREAIRSGRLGAGTALPATRTLAAELGVSRGIVVEAFEQLAAEGYLTSRPGGATRVAPNARAARVERPRTVVPTAYEFDFRPGRPDLDQFPRDAWLRSIRRALGEAPSDRLGYLDGRGVPELRVALADYLDRVRGTAADAEFDGHLLGLRPGPQARRRGVARTRRTARRHRGPDPAGEPGRSRRARVGRRRDRGRRRRHRCRTSRRRRSGHGGGHRRPSVPDGSRPVAGAPRSAPRLGRASATRSSSRTTTTRSSATTASRSAHSRVSRPTGSCTPGRRARHSHPGSDSAGSCCPASMADAVARAKQSADLGSPAIDQLAFADFIRHGELDRHLRRLRVVYRARRDRILEALTQHLPELRPVGASAGLHVLAWLPPDLDEAAVVEAARVGRRPCPGNRRTGGRGVTARRPHPRVRPRGGESDRARHRAPCGVIDGIRA